MFTFVSIQLLSIGQRKNYIRATNSSQSRLRAVRADYVVNGRQVILPLQATSGGSVEFIDLLL